MTKRPLLEQMAETLNAKSKNIIYGDRPYPYFSLATFLSGLSIIYGGAVGMRNRLYRQGRLTTAKLPCPVISVGNITLGGTGKTPMTLHLSRLIAKLGFKAAVISRGYKGCSERKGAIVSDGRSIRLNARQAGDEPFLLALLSTGLPVIVGRNRRASGWNAIRTFQPDVILLDDAFQHQRLKRDLDLVLLDSKAPFGNTRLFPRGPLREPVVSLLRADAVILTRCSAATPVYYDRLVRAVRPRPVFRAFFKPVVRLTVSSQTPCYGHLLSADLQAAAVFPDAKRLFAFSGLAHNQNFWQTVLERGGDLVGTMAFQDHHNYTSQDMECIVTTARKHRADRLVTTDKDFVRIPPGIALPLEMTVMGMRVEFAHPQRWQDFMESRLKQMIQR